MSLPYDVFFNKKAPYIFDVINILSIYYFLRSRLKLLAFVHYTQKIVNKYKSDTIGRAALIED